MEQIKTLLEDGIQASDLIEIIKIILATVFDFIKDDQGWTEPEVEA